MLGSEAEGMGCIINLTYDAPFIAAIAIECKTPRIDPSQGTDFKSNIICERTWPFM